jgi:hypothetical protein
VTTGAVPELAAAHRVMKGFARRRAYSGRLSQVRELDGPRLDGRERLVAERTQDVVGAPAELARDRQAGAVVIDALWTRPIRTKRVV